MGTITLSVPDGLKQEMSKTDWINWSSVARRAFSNTLKDMQLLKKIREISEISEDDKREVKESVVKDVIKSVERTSEQIRLGKKKPMTRDEFSKWCDSL